MKKELGLLDAVPSKRLFQSIIADYDPNRAICELMDNVLDIWQIQGKSRQLTVDITLDMAQQTIRFEDDAGGVDEEDLTLLVAPGHTKIDEKMQTIGYFGVGTKRAIVALSQDTKIMTRPREIIDCYKWLFSNPRVKLPFNGTQMWMWSQLHWMLRDLDACSRMLQDEELISELRKVIRQGKATNLMGDRREQ